MAYQDSLFQLGMDLTRSSTAQKEDHGEAARVAHSLGSVSGQHETHSTRSTHCTEQKGAAFVERDSERSKSSSGLETAGNHLIIDLHAASKLDDLKHIEQTLKRCVQVAGATLLHIHLQRFTPNGGVSGVVVMAGAHISIYSWPESGYATLDLFMPGEDTADLCVGVLRRAFAASEVIVRANHHGRDAKLPNHVAAAAMQANGRTSRAKTRISKAA